VDSTVAFKLNLRRYDEATVRRFVVGHRSPRKAVQVDSIKTRVESAYGFSA